MARQYEDDNEMAGEEIVLDTRDMEPGDDRRSRARKRAPGPKRPPGSVLPPPLLTNPRLLTNGDPNPFFTYKNKVEYQYECPRAEFVQSLAQPSIASLASKWGLGETTIKRWHDEQRWGDHRGAWMVETARQAARMSQEAIAETRAKELMTRLGTYESLRGYMKSCLERGVIMEQSAKGDLIERPINPGDFKDVAQALKIIDAEMDKILGIDHDKKEGGDAAGLTVKRVNAVVFNFSSTTPGEAPESRALPSGRDLPALPAADSLVSDALEGLKNLIHEEMAVERQGPVIEAQAVYPPQSVCPEIPGGERVD